MPLRTPALLPLLRAAAVLAALGVAAVVARGTVLAGLAGALGGAAPTSGRRPRPSRAPAREPSCGRAVVLTGRSRPCPPTPQKMWPRVEDEDRREIKWGWDSDKGKWIDLQASGIKWWQRPGYLTPNGYRQPPHWNKRDYALCCEELKFAKIEADLITVLKARGMTIEEIRAKASVYEFLEDPKGPKMTNKMMFLMQVKCLYDGKTEELVDMRDLGESKEEEESQAIPAEPRVRKSPVVELPQQSA